MILLKIVIIASSSNSLIETILKCLMNLGVTGLRPPPVGKQDEFVNIMPPEMMYSKICLKQPLKNRQNNGLKDKW